VAIKGEHFPTKVGYGAKLQSGQDPSEDVEHAMSHPEMVSDSLCINDSAVQTHSFISCPCGWSPTIPQVKKPDVVLGWHGYTWSVV
jgi:hypothetical protein